MLALWSVDRAVCLQIRQAATTHRTMLMYSESFQVFATLLLVLLSILVSIGPKKKVGNTENWIRLLVSSGDHAGAAVEGNASLRWMDSDGVEYNVKGQIWLETLYNSSIGPFHRLLFSGVDCSNNSQTSGCLYFSPTYFWTQRKVKSGRSQVKARLVQIHFNQINRSGITDILMTFPLSSDSDAGEIFAQSLESESGGVFLIPTHELFSKKK